MARSLSDLNRQMIGNKKNSRQFFFRFSISFLPFWLGINGRMCGRVGFSEGEKYGGKMNG